jgi:hypothetical protein
MWSRKWQRLDVISCIKQRVLFRPICDSPVTKYFSLASYPEPTPSDLSNRRSDPYQGECKTQIIESSYNPQQFRLSSWCLPSPAWGLIVVKQSFSEWIFLLQVGNGARNILREFHTHFPMGTASDLRKVVSRPSQVRTCLTRRKGLMSHFRNWNHTLIFMDKYFLHMKSQPKLLPKAGRTYKQETTVNK